MVDNFQISGMPSISNKEFEILGKFIYEQCGIKMPSSKKTMLEGRLQKRLRQLGIKSFSAYYDYVTSSHGRENELVQMINVVTTNKTDFFREPMHFKYLVDTVLPALSERYGCGVTKPLWIWSAGCSSGEEPYTLAMVLSDYSEACRGFKYSILGTDISMKVLEEARRAVYSEEKAVQIPPATKKKYLMVAKDRSKRLVRIVPELRRLVKFRWLNFMERDFGMREPMDIIFCRNVIIYFDRATQEQLINRFCKHLISGGYIFLGHSETLHGLNVPLTQVAPTVYIKTV